MEFETESGGRAKLLDLTTLRAALTTLDPERNTFAILLRSEDSYLQTSARDDGFIVEKRDGSHLSHFCAAHMDFHAPPSSEHKWWQVWRSDTGQDRFSRDEMMEIFTAYLRREATPSSVRWVRMPMQKAPPWGEVVLNLISYLIGAVFIGILALIILARWNAR